MGSAAGRIKNNKSHPLNNKEWLYDHYIVKDLSPKEIAIICNDSAGNVRYYIRKYGILKPNKRKVGWSKGLTKETDERVARIAEKNKDNHFQKGRIPWNKGRTKADTPNLGSYKWSEEQKQKFSFDRSGEKHPLYGKHHSPEAIEKIRQASIGRSRIVTEEQKIAASKRNKEMWETTDIRERVKIILNSPEIKAKMTGPNNPQFGKPAYPGSGHGKGGYYTKYNGLIVWLRSSFEMRVANLLDLLRIEWDYEGIGYDLGNTGTYFPDFWLPKYSLWIEVKGFMTDVAKHKMLLFHELYPTEKLIILYGSDITDMEEYTENGIFIDIPNCGISITDQVQKWKLTSDTLR
jgi:hypothetical protein